MFICPSACCEGVIFILFFFKSISCCDISTAAALDGACKTISHTASKHDANAWHGLDVALIMPALFLHVQRRRGAVLRGGEGGGDSENEREGEEKRTGKME